MTDTFMSVLLIAISGVLLFVILGWELTRRIIINDTTRVHRSEVRLKKIHDFYILVLILFIACGCVYLLDPASRPYFGPIRWLNHDIINATGFVLLTIAFILIIRAQKKLDRETHLYYQDLSQTGSTRLVPDTENHLTGCILLVYLGMFIVVSTIVTLVLLVIALIGWYIRFSSRKYKGVTPVKGRQAE